MISKKDWTSMVYWHARQILCKEWGVPVNKTEFWQYKRCICQQSPCCAFLFCQFPLCTLKRLTILFGKSIIQKSHVVQQTTLSGNNAARLILLISCNREPSRHLGHKVLEWRFQILIPCWLNNRDLRIRGKKKKKILTQLNDMTCVKQNGKNQNRVHSMSVTAQ